MPELNTSSERSIIAQSSERPWHLCMVTEINGNCFLHLFHDHELAFYFFHVVNMTHVVKLYRYMVGFN